MLQIDEFTEEGFTSSFSVSFYIHYNLWAAVCKKVPNVLSRCHTKRRMDGYIPTRPSFFWYDTDFWV